MHTFAPLPSPLTVTISKLKLIKYIYVRKSQISGFQSLLHPFNNESVFEDQKITDYCFSIPCLVSEL